MLTRLKTYDRVIASVRRGQRQSGADNQTKTKKIKIKKNVTRPLAGQKRRARGYTRVKVKARRDFTGASYKWCKCHAAVRPRTGTARKPFNAISRRRLYRRRWHGLARPLPSIMQIVEGGRTTARFSCPVPPRPSDDGGYPSVRARACACVVRVRVTSYTVCTITRALCNAHAFISRFRLMTFLERTRCRRTMNASTTVARRS